MFEECTKAILVDAIKTGANIGQVHRLDLDHYAPSTVHQGMHGSGVETLLAALPIAFANSATPRVILIGAEVGQIVPFTTELSPPVAEAIVHAAKLVMLECTHRAATEMRLPDC
jgi:hydrogenase maturation protease